jgi:hypothetical protein
MKLDIQIIYAIQSKIDKILSHMFINQTFYFDLSKELKLLDLEEEEKE